MVISAVSHGLSDGNVVAKIKTYLPRDDRVSLGFSHRAVAINPLSQPTWRDLRFYNDSIVPGIRKARAYKKLLTALQLDKKDRFNLGAVYEAINDPDLDMNMRVSFPNNTQFEKDYLHRALLDEDAKCTAGTHALATVLHPVVGSLRLPVHPNARLGTSTETRRQAIEIASLLISRGAKPDGVTFYRGLAMEAGLPARIRALAAWSVTNPPKISPESIQRFNESGLAPFQEPSEQSHETSAANTTNTQSSSQEQAYSGYERDAFLKKYAIHTAIISHDGNENWVPVKDVIPPDAFDLEFHQTFTVGYVSTERVLFTLPNGEKKSTWVQSDAAHRYYF